MSNSFLYERRLPNTFTKYAPYGYAPSGHMRGRFFMNTLEVETQLGRVKAIALVRVASPYLDLRSRIWHCVARLFGISTFCRRWN